MGRTWRLAGAAAALLAVAAGLVMPQAVLEREDRRLFGRVDTYETAPVKFYGSRQVTDTLRLLSGEYSVRSLPDSYARMSREQVDAAARAFLDDMGAAGLFAGETAAFSLASAAPQLYDCSGTGMELSLETQEGTAAVFSRSSAVVWECTLTDGTAGSVRLTVDDATGLIVSVSCWQQEGELPSADTQERWEELQAFAQGCREFLGAYYGLENGEIHYDAYPDSAQLDYRTDEQDDLSLQLTMRGNSFSVWVA